MKFVVALLSWILIPFLQGYSQNSATDVAFFDTSVVGVSLLDLAAVQKLDDVKFEDSEGGEGFKYAQLLNTENTELLILTILAETNQITEYCYYYFKEQLPSKRIQLSSFKEFKSGKGILLGMSENELFQRLGSPVKVEQHGIYKDCEYRLKDKESPLLKKYKANEYLATYRFMDGKLIDVKVQFFLP